MQYKISYSPNPKLVSGCNLFVTILSLTYLMFVNIFVYFSKVLNILETPYLQGIPVKIL